MTADNEWIHSLHQKRQKEFFSLPAQHQSLIMSRSERNRRSALRVLDHDRRGINGREYWVTGLNHLEAFMKDVNHFFKLTFDGKVADVEAMTDILIDFQMGDHDNIKNTDPFLYDLISKAAAKFKLNTYDCLDGVAMALYFKKHPERRPFKSRFPSAQEIAQKKAMKVGVDIKTRRRQLGLTAAALATSVGSCEKTIKNLEAGRAVSSHTFLMVHQTLSKPFYSLPEQEIGTKKAPTV